MGEVSQLRSRAKVRNFLTYPLVRILT